MHYTIVEISPCRLWMALVAQLPACVGCGDVLRATPDRFCVGCLDRSRDSLEDELGGES
jgi:hypothetical protein